MRQARLAVSTAILMGLIIASGPTVASSRPAIECPIIDTAPVIDGVLDDPIWRQAAVSDYLQHFQGVMPGDPETRFRIYTDGEWLYIGIELADERADELSRENLGRDNADWRQTAEIFIAPDVYESTYYQFAVNPGGGDYDNRELGSATDNNYTWRHAQHIGDDGWSTEIAILLADLGRPRLAPGDMMHLNIARANEHGPVTHQAWSPTGTSFHNRQAFGTVVVGSFAQAARAELTALAAQFDSLKAELDLADEAAAKAVKALEVSFTRLESDLASLSDDAAWQAFSRLAGSVRSEMSRLAHAGAGLVVWEVVPWHLPAAETLPAADQTMVEQINLTALQGEYLTVALAVANVTDDVVELRCLPSDFISPDWRRRTPVGDVLSVHQAVTIALSGNNRYRDPLPELNTSTPLCLAPARNGIIWLTINTHEIDPGQWTSNLELKPLVNLDLARNLQLNLTVLPAAMPAGPRPYSGNWPHHERPLFRDAAAAYMADQKAHYTNMHTHGGRVLTTIKYDDDGNIASGPDFSRLEALIDFYGTEGQLYLLPDFYTYLPRQLAGGGSWGQKEQENFAWAVREVRRFFESKGMTVQDYAWYAQDEPSDVEAATAVANFGKLIQAADPEQQVFVTVYSKVTMEALEIMAPYVTLWCPTLNLTPEQRGFIQALPDVRIVSYTVNPRTSDSYWSYRLAASKAFDYGYEGIGFWSYDDASMSVWDDTDGDGVDYAVVYESPEGPVGSVRWEAWRHGIQDFRYLEWLGELAAACPDADLAQAAQSLAAAILQDNLKNPDKATADNNNTLARDMAVRLLAEMGRVDAAEIARLYQPMPVCLTGNAGAFGLNMDTGGYYTYNVHPSPQHGGEGCGTTEGPVYFRGRNAVAPPQSSNRLDGNLTDGLLRYPRNYSIHWWPPAVWSVTFDLNLRAELSHALLYSIDLAGPIEVSVSEDAAGPWQKVAEVTDMSAAPESFDGGVFFDLQDSRDRFVKFDIRTGGKAVRLGEIRIFGRPRP